MMSLPASIFDKSRISLISPSKILSATLDPSERLRLLVVERTVDARQQRVGESEDRRSSASAARD